jgi:hypothetical protein
MASSSGECALCGVETPSLHFDAECPVFEAWEIVMAEWARAVGDRREP